MNASHKIRIDLIKKNNITFDRVPKKVIWWAMRKLRIEEKLVRFVQTMYEDKKIMVKVGDGYSKEFDVVFGVHQGSVLNSLLFIIVLETISMEFRTGAPWELLYADDLVFISDKIEDLIVKLNTWIEASKMKGLKVKMMKNKVMISGCNPDFLKKYGKYPCGVCFNSVGSNSILCIGCK